VIKPGGAKINYEAEKPAKRLSRKPQGIAVVCSVEAVVCRVVYDGLGLSHELDVGTNLSALFDPASLSKSREFLKAAQDNQTADKYALDIVANGRTMPLWFSAEADSSGGLRIVGGATPVAAAKIWREFVEESEEPAELLPSPPPFERNRTIEDRSEEKTRWLLSAAHDLYKQVNAILSYAEMLTEELPQKNEMVDMIHSSADAMLHLLTDMTDIALAESGRVQLDLGRTDLSTIIDESISLSRPAAERRGTSLRAEYRGAVPEMIVDPIRIRHVFVNLLDNAIKYSQDGADVVVEIVTSGTEVVIAVRDNGPGIPPDELNLIFTPFQKTRARAASPYPGTGLGLAICRQIVEQHGGRIWPQSNFGEGATFYVALPVDGSS